MAAGILALSVAALGAGCSQAPSGPPNVVMVVLDTTRPSFTSVYGASEPTTPFLQTLAAAGTRFERAYSSSSWTLPAHGTLFTGTHPKLHGANQTHLKINPDLSLLAVELGRSGYQTTALSGNVWVSERSGLDLGFDYFRNLSSGIYQPHVKRLAADRSGIRSPAEEHYVAREVLHWIEHERDPERPFFLFVNLVEPHLPYLPDLESAGLFLESPDDRWKAIQAYYPDGRPQEILSRHYVGQDPLAESEWDLLRRMYQGEIRVVDEITRVIFEAVDAISDPDDTLCFVLSDHGENLGDHGHFTHIMNLYDSNLRIVLLARGPGFGAGHVEDRLVGIHDLYPTILSAAGLDPGEHLSGVDLRATIPPRRVLTAALEYPKVSLRVFPASSLPLGRHKQYERTMEAAIGPRFKLISSVDSATGAVEVVLFDLQSDPDETRPLSPADVPAAQVRALWRALNRARNQAIPERAANGSDWEGEQALDDMRAMGYIGGDD